jgi:hypothetical protein
MIKNIFIYISLEDLFKIITNPVPQREKAREIYKGKTKENRPVGHAKPLCRRYNHLYAYFVGRHYQSS